MDGYRSLVASDRTGDGFGEQQGTEAWEGRGDGRNVLIGVGDLHVVAAAGGNGHDLPVPGDHHIGTGTGPVDRLDGGANGSGRDIRVYAGPAAGARTGSDHEVGSGRAVITDHMDDYPPLRTSGRTSNCLCHAIG